MAVLAVLFFAVSVPAQDVGARTRLHFGIHTGQEQVSWAQLLDTWKTAENLGYDSAWVFDHLMPIGEDKNAPCLEAWTTLSALAAQTQRIRVGTLVTANTIRNPALLAKMATTVDQISNGRLNLGIGAAWFEAEHKAYGLPFYTAKQRAARLGEALEVITRLWTQDHPSFSGKFYSLDQAPFAPKPLQKPHPPIIIGGQGKKWIMPLVARYADGWNVPIGIGPDGIRERRQIIAAECARLGRTPCAIEISVLLPLLDMAEAVPASPTAGLRPKRFIGKNRLSGSKQEIIDEIQRYVDAGVTTVIVSVSPPFDRQLITRFATEIIPAFASR